MQNTEVTKNIMDKYLIKSDVSQTENKQIIKWQYKDNYTEFRLIDIKTEDPQKRLCTIGRKKLSNGTLIPGKLKKRLKI